MNEWIAFVKEHFYFPILDQIGGPSLGILITFLLVAESIWILRPRKISRWERIKTNFGVAISALLVLRIALIPFLVLTAQWAYTQGWGLLNWLHLPHLLEFVTGFLLLDYGIYFWHVLNHRIPFLWRFHNVHHIDLDLDVTTAFRFHFGEILLSCFFRGLMILLLGAPVVLVLVYEVVFELATNFHHSNWKLPYGLEKTLARFIVTPRMHGIHHSIVERETNSNYSSVLNLWDRMHRSIKLNIPQEKIDIGVPAYRDPNEQTVFKLLWMPFQKQRSWKLPDGTAPEREKDLPEKREGKLVR